MAHHISQLFYNIFFHPLLMGLDNFVTTNLLKRAGEVAALSLRPSDDGFMVNTTWRFLITCKINE